MGFFNAGKATSTSTTTNTPNVPQWLLDAYQSNTQKGIAAANQPFNFTSSDVIQPFSDDQLNAFNQVRTNQGQYQNVFDTALGTQNQIIQQGLNGPSANQITNLMNPYVSNVIDATRAGATRQADIERNQINQSSANAGAFGGSRQAVQNRELNQGLQTQLNDVQYRGLADAYNNAQNQYNTGINQAGNAANSSVANATSANSYNNQDINNLLTTGGQQQALGQQAKNFDFYKNYQQPLDAANYTQSLLGGVPTSMYGYTNTTDTSSKAASPSMFSQLAGLGLSAAGLGLPGGGTILGSILGGAGAAAGAGSLAGVNPAQLSTQPGTFMAQGGRVKGYAAGGLVSDEDAQGLTIPGTNVPNGVTGVPFQGDHNILNAILSPKQQAIFGTGKNSGFKTPMSGNVVDNMLAPPTVLNNRNAASSEVHKASSLPSSVPLATDQGMESSSASLSPLDLVKQSAGKPSVADLFKPSADDEVTRRNEADPLNRIIKNSNYPLLAMGLSLLGSDRNFPQALGDSGLKGLEVALSQQKEEASSQAKQKEFQTKLLELQQASDKASQIAADKAASRTLTQRGQDLQRQSASERNAAYKAKTDAATGMSPTKLIIQATKEVDGRLANDIRLQGKVAKDPTLRQSLIDDQYKRYMDVEQKKADSANELAEQVQELKDGKANEEALSTGEDDSAPSDASTQAYNTLKATGKYTDAQIREYLKAKGL